MVELLQAAAEPVPFVQFLKVEFGDGRAFSVMVVPGLTEEDQSAPQFMSVLSVTVPVPDPLLVTVIVTGAGGGGGGGVGGGGTVMVLVALLLASSFASRFKLFVSSRTSTV